MSEDSIELLAEPGFQKCVEINFFLRFVVTGAVEYDFVHLVTAWPRPNIPVLVIKYYY